MMSNPIMKRMNMNMLVCRGSKLKYIVHACGDSHWLNTPKSPACRTSNSKLIINSGAIPTSASPNPFM